MCILVIVSLFQHICIKNFYSSLGERDFVTWPLSCIVVCKQKGFNVLWTCCRTCFCSCSPLFSYCSIHPLVLYVIFICLCCFYHWTALKSYSKTAFLLCSLVDSTPVPVFIIYLLLLYFCFIFESIRVFYSCVKFYL